MKRFSILFITLLLLSLTPGCKEETAIENAPYVHISGNNISAFHETTPVRASTDETFPASSIISFYSEGALSASGIPLTWTGQHWESKEPLVWTNASPSAEIKAYYPADVFESQKLYNDAGELADILFASQSSQSGNINLTFGHLFSKITFRIAHSFNHRIQKLTITPSHLVSFIPNCRRCRSGCLPHLMTLTARSWGTSQVILWLTQTLGLQQISIEYLPKSVDPTFIQYMPILENKVGTAFLTIIF